MAKPATGSGSDYGAGSVRKTSPAPQPTKRASMKAAEASLRRSGRPR